MKTKKPKPNKLLLPLGILYFALLSGCYQPVLEPAECIEARVAVKRFYSFHIGNEMAPSEEYLKVRGKFLSSELEKRISAEITSKRDYFTRTEDYPKAFRAGKCKTAGKDRTKFEILLFWRTEEENIQREIEVEAIKKDNDWLIDRVTSKN
jgi:hypothetical protein